MDPTATATATATITATATPSPMATVVACVYQVCTSDGSNAADGLITVLAISCWFMLFGFFLWLAVDGLKTTAEA